jgi:anaerobic magnesium-protoporphyrin IX monomethyl ester cyclase
MKDRFILIQSAIALGERPTPAPPKADGSRRKVVFYNPWAVFYTMPLGLLAVASYLDPARYEVVIVDGRLEEDPVKAVLEHLDGALCLGVSVLTGDPIRDALRISRAAKQARPDLPVVWGGWHPSLFGTECLEEASVDVTVQGQGEATFGEIVERLAAVEDGAPLKAEPALLADCLGCAYRAPDGTIVQNAARPLLNLNSFPRHNYDLLPVERYFQLKGKPQIDYISSQGCAFRCAFCADPFVYKRKWVGLEPERIGEEIEELWKRYRFNDVNFQDETFFTYADRVEAIADEFIRRKLPITWAATMRADQGARLSEEVMAQCKRSGLRRVIIGVESGSQEMMDRIRKDIKLEQVFISAEKCLRHQVAVHFPFIVGFPDETDESVQASLDVAKRLRSMSPDFLTPFFYYKPYPGSSLTDDAVAGGYSLPCSLEEWAGFDFIGSAGPWVSPEKYRLVERFKFYQQVAWERPRPWSRPLQAVARWRLQKDFYGAPLEKAVSQWLRPAQRLS